MRVISGTAKGRRLRTIQGSDTRPTTDRIKENVFNIVASRVPGAVVLDLFAGSGALGIEAKSRGASCVVLVESNRRAAAAIRENLQHTQLTADLLVQDYRRAAAALGRQSRQFDLIFLDPPYGRDFVTKTLKAIAENKLLAQEGLLVAEYGTKEDIPSQLLNLVETRREIYGSTCLGFYQTKEDVL